MPSFEGVSFTSHCFKKLVALHFHGDVNNTSSSFDMKFVALMCDCGLVTVSPWTGQVGLNTQCCGVGVSFDVAVGFGVLPGDGHCSSINDDCCLQNSFSCTLELICWNLKAVKNAAPFSDLTFFHVPANF